MIDSDLSKVYLTSLPVIWESSFLANFIPLLIIKNICIKSRIYGHDINLKRFTLNIRIGTECDLSDFDSDLAVVAIASIFESFIS